ncbi:MAG: long-chain-fatty-acid--CoA ligase [Gammaproteobacteria bacterium]|nr:MAG: long-chain-fatty-acid--CoA ligase [Gammaproteobacteria bacterium]
MDKSWLRSYPAGIPHTIELDPEESLVDLFAEACEKYADRPAFTNYGHTISYTELDDLSARFAAWLQTETGLDRGDRVAIMMPNLLQYPITLFGVLRAGMVIVNVNPLYTARELEHQLIDSRARAIVIASTAAATLAEIIDETSVEQVVVTGIGDLLGFPRRPLVNFVVRYVKRMVPAYTLANQTPIREVLATPADRGQSVSLSADDIACLQYTGGTTGRSKGATLTHGNLVANVRQLGAWFDSRVDEGAEIMITALPLYHVYALTCNCLTYLYFGAQNILITDPRDTAGFIAELKKWKFTAITGVNTLYQSLINHPRFAEVDFSSLDLASAGGMAVMDDTAQKWFKVTGTEIIEGYGLSETSPVVTSNPVNIPGFSGSIGLPLPSTDISLRDENGKEVPVGEPGELCVSGPQVMSGYWNDDAATAAAMTPDGYLKTGDIATVDENGFFRIVDRKKDMIIVSGFNVYPNEVENVVTMHPEIVEAACIGVKNNAGREIVKVFVVLRAGSSVTVDEIRDYCRENLAAYKVPKLVEFRDTLPKTAVGKILRRALREDADE